ncbi:MAG: apolipoprotein N-acyltransferase [Austwickia sp.]|nr:apolipoprotein N-acyltransferase [Austwickia sp.]
MPLRLLIALVAGLCLWAAFPAIDAWPLAWVGAGLWSLAAYGAGPGRAFLLGTATGLACFGPLLSWSGIYVGVLPWLALAVSQSLYVGAGAALFALATGGPRGARRGTPGWSVPLLAATSWVAAEWARATTPWGGFPWARLAFSQADSPLAGWAAVGGAPAVSFAVVLIGSATLWAGCAFWRRIRGGARRAVFPVLALLAFLTVLLGVAIPWPTDGEPATVLLVQGNVPQAGLDFNAQRRAVLDNHVRATMQAAAEVRLGVRAAPDLVVWPENASDIDPLREADAAEQIQAATRAIDAPILVGAVLDEPVGHVTNAALWYSPAGHVTARYDKRHPVPFAEYIPWRPFFRLFSDHVDRVSRDFVAGERLVLFSAPVAAGGEAVLGPNICFEVAYDDLVRDGVVAGASIIVVQTNNATFGRTDESVQQLAISRLRAIEHGRSVIHNSNVGVSALITPDGVAHDQTELFTTALRSRELPRRTELTLATRAGRWPEALLTLAALGGGITGVVRRRA